VVQMRLRVDPLAENHYDHTPYNYVLGNPVKYADFMGLDTITMQNNTQIPRAGDDIQGNDGSLTRTPMDAAVVTAKMEKPQDNGWLPEFSKWNGGIGTLAGGVEALSGAARLGTEFKLHKPLLDFRQYLPTTKISALGKAGGLATFGLGTIVDGVGVLNYYRLGASDPNSVSPAKFGVNAGVGVYGVLGGIPGAIVGAGYYGIDTFYPGGFPAAMDKWAEIDRNERKSTGYGILTGPKGF